MAQAKPTGILGYAYLVFTRLHVALKGTKQQVDIFGNTKKKQLEVNKKRGKKT